LKEESTSFLKKRSKKLLFIGADTRAEGYGRGRRGPAREQTFFGAFFQKRTA
jgi:hypothetical protein